MSRDTSGASHLHQGTAAPVELFTMAALAVSTVIAATAVSIGIARADVMGAVAGGDCTPLAVLLSTGLLLTAMLLPVLADVTGILARVRPED
jgi:hypothetical protein